MTFDPSGLVFLAILVPILGAVAFAWWKDPPRFCPDCGKAIEVKCAPTFDPKTGTERGVWVWSCPDVYLTVTHSGITRASQTGYVIHTYGEGRPRWHAAEVEA